MKHEDETSAPFLRDSWDRLSWVEEQVERVRDIVKPWSDLSRDASVLTNIDEAATRPGRIEFCAKVGWSPELPPTVNFLIGNIVTDARSCLDMAIDGLWRQYGLEAKGVQVQFPLEDDFPSKRDETNDGRRLRLFLGRLDSRFVEVIEDAQPHYAGGLIDKPANLSAIFISKLSNANKHRNITPVVLRTVLSSHGTSASGLRLSALDADARRGVPPLRFALDYDSTAHTDEDARGYVEGLRRGDLRPLQVHMVQTLVIDKQEIPFYPPRFGSRKIELRAELEELLSKVPKYIRLTLRNLSRVHNVIEEGDDRFYMLDSDGTL